LAYIKSKNITLIKNQIEGVKTLDEIPLEKPINKEKTIENIYDKIRYKERPICPDCNKGRLIPVLLIKGVTIATIAP